MFMLIQERFLNSQHNSNLPFLRFPSTSTSIRALWFFTYSLKRVGVKIFGCGNLSY